MYPTSPYPSVNVQPRTPPKRKRRPPRLKPAMPNGKPLPRSRSNVLSGVSANMLPSLLVWKYMDWRTRKLQRNSAKSLLQALPLQSPPQVPRRSQYRVIWVRILKTGCWTHTQSKFLALILNSWMIKRKRAVLEIGILAHHVWCISAILQAMNSSILDRQCTTGSVYN